MVYTYKVGHIVFCKICFQNWVCSRILSYVFFCRENSSQIMHLTGLDYGIKFMMS